MRSPYIKKIDNVKIAKFSDLSGYLSSKRPNDMVRVTINRKGNIKTIPVKLVKTSIYEINRLGIQVKNLSKKDRKSYKIKDGVKITRTTRYMSQYGLEGKILVGINDEEVNSIDDVKRIVNNTQYENIVLEMLDENGEKERIVFR